MSGKREFDDCDDGKCRPIIVRCQPQLAYSLFVALSSYSGNDRVRARCEASNTTSKRGKGEVSNIVVKAKSKKAKGETNGLSFPEKLMQIMEHRGYWDAIMWSSDGLAFGINPETFSEKVIDTHFQGGLFESMQKRLSRWGFQRIQMHIEFTGSWITYHHVLFRRGKSSLFRNLSSTEMNDVMTKSKEESWSSAKKMLPSQQPMRQVERPSTLTNNSQAICTSPLVVPSYSSISRSLQHPLSMNFVHSQNRSRLNVGDLSLPSQDFLQVSHHRPSLLSLQQHQLLNYLRQIASPPIVLDSSSDPIMALSRGQPVTQPRTEHERLLSLLSTNHSDYVDELRVASLTDEQLLTLYLRSRQL